jgi:hypothetical protein
MVDRSPAAFVGVSAEIVSALGQRRSSAFLPAQDVLALCARHPLFSVSAGLMLTARAGRMLCI